MVAMSGARSLSSQASVGWGGGEVNEESKLAKLDAVDAGAE